MKDDSISNYDNTGTHRHSSETYKGQRSKEKRDLFKRFGYRVIVEHYKKKFFNLFGNHCFKCGSTNYLNIDHHIPMALGGHLVPDNLVALCKRCNNKKLDSHPEEFYTIEELSRLEAILKEQNNVFEFEFDSRRWKENRKEYLISLGISPILVDAVLNNQNHQYYIEPELEISISFSIDKLEI
jgi:hypothetical protein